MKLGFQTFASGVALTLTTLASAAQAQDIEDPCKGPKIPTCRAQFSDLSDQDKAVIQSFSLEGLIARDLSVPARGDEDADPAKNYLKPKHPRPQPDVKLSNWRGYSGVPNDDGVGAIDDDARSRTYGGETYPFRTVPEVKAPDNIGVTYVRTPKSIYPEIDPFLTPPGTNMLPTLNRELVNDKKGIVPNTVPSTKANPYNLHDGKPHVTQINPESPIEDLRYVLESTYEVLTGRAFKALYQELDADTAADTLKKSAEFLDKGNIKSNEKLLRHLLGWAVDMIEGNDGRDSRVPGNRSYRGFALLNHSGHKRVRCVEPVYDSAGNIVGGNANVHQIWYGGRIQSDAMFLDFGWNYLKNDGTFVTASENGYGGRRCDNGKSPPTIPPNKPWTVTYTVDALHASRDDFSPTGMFFDCPQSLKVGKNDFKDECPAPHVDVGSGPVQWKKKKLPTGFAMDQTFFPMAAGTRTVLKIKMPPPMYYKLTYTWGWRQHPPRAQAMENTHQSIPPQNPKPIAKHEFDTFTDDTATAIAKISDLAPAKRMWNGFRELDRIIVGIDNQEGKAWKQDVLALLLDLYSAYRDWLNRTQLPSGFKVDSKSDLTMLYINNTMYGEFTDGGSQFHDWRTRSTGHEDSTGKLKVTLINADYFRHGYINVDFGGLRGWENQFKPSIKTGGAGSFFTFGRFYHRPNVVPGSISVDPATPPQWDADEGKFTGELTPGVHRVMIEYNFEPSPRLRFYQFDPLHHDVAIYSIH